MAHRASDVRKATVLMNVMVSQVLVNREHLGAEETSVRNYRRRDASDRFDFPPEVGEIWSKTSSRRYGALDNRHHSRLESGHDIWTAPFWNTTPGARTTLITGLIAGALLIGAPEPDGKFVKIFNGKNLDGWTAKIKGYELGQNFANTFRVKDGVIQVRYDGYGGKFDGRFGHLFYKNTYSNYIVRLEYRFVGEQIADGPSWAWRNSGLMIHGQDPKTMAKDQDFPVSAEVQLLGAGEKDPRTTGNLCTPGTNVMMNDELVTRHCNDSTSETYRGDQWVRLEVEVHGQGAVIHRINGKEVLRYEGVQLDPRDPTAKPLMRGDSVMVSQGTLSLQSESHPCEFRNIEILKLER